MYREQRTNQKLRTTNQSEIRNQRTDQNQESTNRSKLGIIEPIRIRNQQINRESERNCIQQLCTEITYTKKRKKKKIRTLQQNEETSGKIHENNTRYPKKNEKRTTREYIRK
jgi:hypothetical protein